MRPTGKRPSIGKHSTLLLLMLVSAISVAALAAGCGAASSEVGSAPTAALAAATATSVKGSASGPTASTAASAQVLQVTGPAGEKSFTVADLEKMPAVEGYAGYTCPPQPGVTGPSKYKGVALEELLKAVGGLPADSAVSVAASDGYIMTFNTDQILKGNFTTYDPVKGTPQNPKVPVRLMLAYQSEGKPLDADEGPFRLVFATDKPEQVVEGFLCVKWTQRIKVQSLAADWTLQLSGAKSMELDRSSFGAIAGSANLEASWQDINARTWTGIPLWVLVGLIDGKTKVDAGSFDKNLAASGYQVQVTGADGTSVTLDSAKIAMSNDYMVANAMEGNPLGDNEFPLRLVGAGPTGAQMVNGIKEIRLLLPH